jgi:foldase protein PrsA
MAVAIVVLMAALASCTPTGSTDVVARVDGQAITVADLMQELYLRRGPSQLVEIIDRYLIHQAAEESGISVDSEDMQRRWERAVAEAGSEADLEALLERRNLTREQFRSQLRTDLLLNRLAKASIRIDEQEIRDFYREHEDDYRLGERVRARMILVSTRANAETIAEALDAGGDFAGLAGALSIDPATKEQGGDMGWFEREDYADEITDRAFEMQDGEVSEPFEVPDGWVILQVEGHREPGVRPLEEVRDAVRARIVRAKLPGARKDWIKQARLEATLRITNEELREETLRALEDAPPPGPVTLMPVPPRG